LEEEMYKLIAIIVVIALAVALMVLSVWTKKRKPYETLGEWNKKNKQV
jgi:uncharacterized protein YpmB